MGRSQETQGKKEKEKKSAQKKREKVERAEERRANNNKGKGLEDMMAYIDENGNISHTPPDPRKMKTINQEDIQIGVVKRVDENYVVERKGVVTFFNDSKGYGFINDLQSQESVFVHINQLLEPIKETDKVLFETEHSPRGLSAIKVRKGS